ncbi:MAG TPA: transcription termination/antitermination protein NusG [Phycisphaerae bacterium]|nr:transcription termination/antitermination protein NusG [Phycisphaerae bacterium]
MSTNSTDRTEDAADAMDSGVQAGDEAQTGGDAGESHGGGGQGAHAGESAAPASKEPLCKPGMNWYVLRVASNKEEYVRDALERKVKIEGLDNFVSRILVPTIKERRMKGGVAKVHKRNLYPGYVFVEMSCEDDGAIPEDVWFMVKETTGVGDFIGSDGKPTPMPDHEIEGMLAASQEAEETPSLSGLNFKKGDHVKITAGSFENFEGDVDSLDEKRGMVTVIVEIFGRSTPVDVEYWQLEREA